MNLIDIHCHTIPEGFLDKMVDLAEGCTEPAIVRKDGTTYKVYDNGGFSLPMNEELFSPKVILERMDSTGVDLSLISGSPDPGFLPANRQPEACRLLNDCIAEIVRDYPGRFRGIGVLPWAVPEASVQEAARIKALGFVSVIMFSHHGKLLVDDPVMNSSFQACSDLDLPISLHPDIPLWFRDVNRYNMVSNVSLVMDTSLSMLRLIYSGVFERFPYLQVIMPHAGGVLPYLDGRLSYTPPDFRRFVPKDQKKPPDILRSGNIWFDVSNPSIPVLKMAREYLGPERMMFGSDYPFVEQDYLQGLLRQAGYTPDELDGIFHRNAEKLFGQLS